MNHFVASRAPPAFFKLPPRDSATTPHAQPTTKDHSKQWGSIRPNRTRHQALKSRNFQANVKCKETFPYLTES